MSDPRQSSSRPPLSELSFHYQRIVGLDHEAPVWVEALVRWNRPDGTVSGPADVLPHWLAEARHERFTRYSVERAAAFLALHRTAYLSINLSPRQLVSPTTSAILEGLLPDVASRLRVEVTEQRFDDSHRLWGNLEVIRRQCGAVLLDDVTETDLRERVRSDDLVDGVKIDRSVTLGIVEGGRRKSLERFVAELTTRFPVVVVEGVEDAALCEGFAALGVSHLQGFGIGRPQAEPLVPLNEPRLPWVEASAAKASRLHLGPLLLGGSDSDLDASELERDFRLLRPIE